MSDDLNSVKTEKPYHHGALRDALIAAGEAILAERGVEGFSLREAARRAGVSPGAPAHHFGDARGLLTAIAARGFEGLAKALLTAEKNAEQTPTARLRAQGPAYVGFALANPAQFNLMWRTALLDHSDRALATASKAAWAALENAISGTAAESSCADSKPSPSAIAAWSIVHGYARLALDGAFNAWEPGLLDGVLRCLVLPEHPRR